MDNIGHPVSVRMSLADYEALHLGQFPHTVNGMEIIVERNMAAGEFAFRSTAAKLLTKSKEQESA